MRTISRVSLGAKQSSVVRRRDITAKNIYIISEETSIFAPQRLRFYQALGADACTVGEVRASTVFMCVCSMFRPSDFFTIRHKRIRGGGALPR